jgi:hypothetical protein
MAGLAALAGAQESSKLQAAAPRTIILPQRVVAGTPTTLAVLDVNGHLSSDVSVELSSGQKISTDATGRALFVAPSDAGALTARISGQETTAVTDVVVSPDSAPPASVEGSPGVVRSELSFPRFLTLHDRFTIDGKGFNGRADSNRVRLADQACLIVAASPVSLVVLPGLHIPIGMIALHVNGDGHDLGAFPVTAVLLEFIGPNQAPNAGAQSKLTLRVRGTNERLEVEVRNGSPEIIQFIHGNVQRLRTSGGEQNIAQVDMKLLAAGNYVVTARLIYAGPVSPDMGAIRNGVSAIHAETGQFRALGRLPGG